MYVAVYLLEQPCLVGTFSKRHITVNFPSLSVDLQWFLLLVSSGCSVSPNGKLMLQTATKSQPGPVSSRPNLCQCSQNTGCKAGSGRSVSDTLVTYWQILSARRPSC